MKIFTTVAVLVLAFVASAQARPGDRANSYQPKGGASSGIEDNVRQCVGLGYKRSCCVSSYSKMAAGAMNNQLRHQQIAKCSGVPPRG